MKLFVVINNCSNEITYILFVKFDGYFVNLINNCMKYFFNSDLIKQRRNYVMKRKFVWFFPIVLSYT